jgi:hypothetical protein
MTAPRDVIAHSQFDDETREMLLGVFDNIARRCRLSETTAITVVDRMLAIAEQGERDPLRVEEQASAGLPEA